MGSRRMSGGRLAGPVRRLLPDRNPLRRTADRVEAAVLALLAVVFLAGAPLAALAGGSWAAAASRSTQRAESSWRPVQATLLGSAPKPVSAAGQGSPEALVRARWLAPDGLWRTGQVYAPGGARAGRTVTIWTDRFGHIVGYPLQHTDVVIRSLLIGLLAVCLLAALLAGVWLVARLLLDRRRLAAWDMSWAVTGPHWTGKR
jgi:hypothetical protein